MIIDKWQLKHKKIEHSYKAVPSSKRTRVKEITNKRNLILIKIIRNIGKKF